MKKTNENEKSSSSTKKKVAVAASVLLLMLISFMGIRNMLVGGIISSASELSQSQILKRAEQIAESGIYVSVTDDYSYHFDGTGTTSKNSKSSDTSDTYTLTNDTSENSDNLSDVSGVSSGETVASADTSSVGEVTESALALQPEYSYESSYEVDDDEEEDDEEGITQTINKLNSTADNEEAEDTTSVQKAASKTTSTVSTTTSTKHTHQYRSKVTKKATCTEDGEITYTCAECGDSYTVTQSATGHNYVSEITKEPTCESEGIKTYTCSLCGDTYTEEIDMLEHTYGDTYDGGDGYTYKKCSVCGDIVVDDIVSYTISYNTDGGTISDSSYSTSYTVKDNVSLPNAEKDGYTFDGWEDSNGNIVTSISSGTTGDLEFTATWSGKKSVITLFYNGKTVDTLSGTVGETVGNLPVLTETGKVFTGWFTSSSSGVKITEDYVITNENMSLYAVFDEKVETITVTDSVTNESTTYTVIYGESIGELTYTEYAGYTFKGFVDSEGNTVTEDTIVSSNMTITAEYEVISYDITYVLNGGSETTQNPASYTVNDSFYLVSPQKEGYYFTGWTGSNGDTPSKSVKIASGTTGELTYTANWSAKNVTYTVNHIIEQSDGSYVTESEVLYAPADSDVTPTVNSYNGYTSPEEQTVTVSANGSTTVDYTYEITEYSISYELNGGEFVTEYKSTYTIYDEVTLCSPERTGYDFVSWLDVNGYTFDGVIPKGTTGNLTYTASWEARVAYLSDGQYINYVIKAVTGMSGSKSKVLNASQTTITKIVRADKEDEDAFVIGLSDYTKTEYDVGAWYDADSGTLYWYSDAAKLVLDSDASYMFANMSALTSVDIVEYFDTSEATTFNYMFTGCTSLTSVDLSSFDTESCTSMTGMFNSCSALTTIYASDSFVTTGLSSSCTMFKNCTSLVGGNGTAYSSSNISSTYATIDTADLPGYFTN